MGSIANGRADALLDASPPVVVAVSIESSPQDGRGAYRIGETVSVRVAFDRSVRVDETAGSPSLALTIGGRERQAIYSHGPNTGDLVFLYRIKDGDTDADGIAVAVDGLALNDAAITDVHNNPAVLKLPGLPDRPGQRVDGERPTPVATRAVAVAGNAVSMAFDEPLDEHSIPAIGAFSVVGQEAAYAVTSVSVEGASVRLALSPAVPDTEAFVSVSYLEPVPASAESIRDGVGNAAASFVSDWYAQQPDAVSRTSRAAREPRTTGKESIGDILARKAQRTPAQRKVSSQLLDARRAQVREPKATAEPGGRQATGATDERVLVDIRADVTAEVLARIRELGGTVVNSVPRYRSVRAELPLAGVESLAELDAVQAIRTADMPVTHGQLPGRLSLVGADALDVVRSGKVDTTEGDVAHQADVARSTYGVDGAGVVVGVISDGVETLADQQATGDVPARVTVLPGQEGGSLPLACGGRSKGSEGTAMLEIVHDLAPGADLFFANGIGGPAQMAQNIEDLCAAGADIIVDDVTYRGLSPFQDDIIAQAVGTVTANGCHYFSSAGNGGNKNDGTASVWEGDFAAGPALDLSGAGVGAVYHDFGGGVTGNEITLDSTRAIVLQWSDPAGGSANDYDLFLIDARNIVLAYSTANQDGSQDPIEHILSPCSPDRRGARLVIVKNADAADRYLRLSYGRGALAITTAGHTFGHSASQDAIGVAAVDVADAGGAGGVFNGTESVETFSSDGPRRIFFEADGTPITPGNFSSTGGRVLQKPDLTAADGVSTSTPGFSTFSGTSAAAPHAAAIAALMLEAAGGPANVTPGDLFTAMAGTALDIEAMGVDRDSGAGIVMAPGAVDAVDVAVANRNRAPTVVNVPAVPALAPGGDAVTMGLAGVFSDPDGDPLTYTVWSSDNERLSLSRLTGTTFTLTPLAPGGMAVTVVATDPEGLSAVLTVEVAVQVGNRDYDADDDGLIDVGSLAQLDVMRYDLDGDGSVDLAANESRYYAVFAEGRWDMGCPLGCSGYELTADLDFDTDGDGDVDAGDDHWNGGAGWTPVGESGNAFTATFDGNGHTLGNLFIEFVDSGGGFYPVGLFGLVRDGVVRGVGLLDVDVTGVAHVGGLVGYSSDGEVRDSFVTGSVSGEGYVGGLVGRSGVFFYNDESYSAVTGSYSTAHVSGREGVGGLVGLSVNTSEIMASYATGHVEGTENVGGLVGRSDGPVAASVATGHVEGGENVGGLVGWGTGQSTITASYATGLVWGDEKVGGLVGRDDRTESERLSGSYWDIRTSGHSIGPGGRTTTALQAPTDYAGIYRTWNLDLDGDTEADHPWDFGTSAQYPALAVDLDGNGEARWQEFGYQLRAGPALTVSTSVGQPVVLAWTAVDTSPWSPAPAVAYAVLRDDGATLEMRARNLAGLKYTDSAVTAGAAYTYQVAVLVDGGAAARSTLVEFVAGVANQPPRVVGTLPDRTLQVGAPEVVDVAEWFSDLDDALTYAASSSDAAVARVSVSGSRVTVTPVAPGRATITVTATESGGSNRSVTQRLQVLVWTGTGFDYDADNDGLIDIVTLAQLDAVRHDLDGDGVPIQSDTAAYAAAFPVAAPGMGCPSGGGCTGYELEADLDFDTNGDGSVDAGDLYWRGSGWQPIGRVGFPFYATFEGNGRTIRNLFSREYGGGLFGGNRGVIRRVGLIDVDVSGTSFVGGLVANNLGEVHASYVTGRVSGERRVGGLVGQSYGTPPGHSFVGTITASYSTARVTGTDEQVGGLVGVNGGTISASYATGRVSGGNEIGGLIGCHYDGSVVASYATGIVSGGDGVGGLIGSDGCFDGSPVVTASYSDSDTSGHGTGTGARTAAQLQAPTGYSGIYSQWNVDLDGNGANDEPWDFGTGSQYPALKVNFDGQGAATWQEFGYQLRAGPTLAATTTETTAGQAQVELTWTAADVSQWTPPPHVTYTVTRADGSTVETLAERLGERRYTDSTARSGATYTYRVAAVVDAGEAVRGVLVVNTPGNSPPVPVATLPDRWLHLGDAAGVEAAEAFQDPEDDTLTVTAASSATGVARVSVSGTRVTITPVAAGTATITVTATDAGGSTASTTQTFTVTVLPSSAIDYDTDDDGLIEISTLRQLNAVREDLDGDGDPGRDPFGRYGTAFFGVGSRQGCGGLTGCVGYELGADLDFDTNGSGLADKDDAYWNRGRGWFGIGDYAAPFLAVFEGNGHTLSNLFADSSFALGLFGSTEPSSVIRHVGLIGVSVSGTDVVGGLAGFNGGSVIGSYVTGTVSGTDEAIGGLVGENRGPVVASYAAVEVAGGDDVGGLIGVNRASVTASYATGRVAGGDGVGGLVGSNGGTVTASYATGPVAGEADAGGLVGSNESNGSPGAVSVSYWDTTTSRRVTGVEGRTTAQLQAPTDYAGIYVSWNVDADGDGAANDLWDFGTDSRYPALKANFDGIGAASWQEFGYQLRAGPTLSVSTESGQPVLTWTAVDASDWTPEPTVVYTVIRYDGTDVEAIASGLEALTHVDDSASYGETHSYQVAAGIRAGEAVRSAAVEVTVPTADTLPPAITSIASDAIHPARSAFTVTITFSKPVTGLTGSEVEVANGTGSNFSGSGAIYRLRVTPDADFEGEVTVTVPAGAAEDSAANPSAADSETFAVDTRAPALAAANGATVNGATLTLTFDETLAATNTAPSAFTVTGATTRAVTGVSVTGTTVQLTLSVPVLNGETGIEVDYDPPSREPIVDAVGNPAASIADRGVTNETPPTTLSTEVVLSLDTASVAEEGGAKTVAVTGMLNRAGRPAATTVTVEVGAAGDTATEGTDYAAVDALTLTIPAYAASGTVRFTLTPMNDRINEPAESLTVRGATTVSGLIVTPSGGVSVGITDDDTAPSLVLSVNASTIDEDGGTATVTVGTGSGSTYATAQTVRLSLAGTATESSDYTISGKTLALSAGVGTGASMVSATLTGRDDDLDDDDETIEITGSRGGVAFGSRQVVTIEDDDWPELTVTFRLADFRVAEGGQVGLPVTLSAAPERRVTIPIEIEGLDGAEAVDYSVSPTSVTFEAGETDSSLRVRASNDSVVDPGERVVLRFGAPLPERIAAGGVAETTVAIRDTDFTFTPELAAGAGTTESDTDTYTVREAASALRLRLRLQTPRGARVADIVDPVVVTLEARENAGGRGMDEDYATERRSGTFGDFGAFDRDLSFAPGDFSDDGACDCARAEKSVSVDIFDDRVHERVEVFGLRLSRKSRRLSVSSQDITVKIDEDDAEPALTLDASPGRIAEAGGTSTVTVSSGGGSTYPTAQTIELERSGTATEGSDYTLDATSLTLPAGVGDEASSVTTAVRAKDDPFDDDAETVVLAASRDGVAFARRTVTIADDDLGSTRVDLSVNPAQVREDAGAATVRVAAALDGGARAEDTALSVTVGSAGDSAVEGTDYATVPDLSLTIDKGETTAETTFELEPENNDTVEGAKTITVDGNVSGLAVRAADLTLNDDDVESTQVTLTLDPLEVRESAGSRTVRVTGTLDGGARPTETVLTVTVGSGADSASEGTDYAEVPELELAIPANRTDGAVSFALRPMNDGTAEGTETISVRGNVAGLTVTPAELAIADDDTVSTRLDLSLNPSTVSEAAAPTEVAVMGSLDAGARATATVVTVTVGAAADAATEGSDYAHVSTLAITVPAHETTGRTMFTLSPENDAIAEGVETISVTGRVSGLTVGSTTLMLSDNDTASRVVTLSVNPESVAEDTPEDVTVTASLNAGARAENTQVRLTVGAAGDTAVPGTDYERVPERTLTVLPGETVGTATFRLEPLDNDSADGARTLSVTGSTTVAELRIEPATGARIALADDDSPAVLLMPQALTVVEAGFASYAVTLQTRPTADVTVTITGAAGDLSLDKTSLVFTGADWSDRREVTVTAADDADSVPDAAVTLTHRASGAAEYEGLRAQLVVSIRENDPGLVFSESALRVPEGQTATYTVALATAPTAAVTVRVTGVSGDLNLDPTRLAFARGDWDESQTVTVGAAEDDDTSTDPAVTLTHRASGGGYDGIVGEVRVTVTENDGGGTGGGSGGGAANRPPAVEREIDDQALDAGEVLELDIRLNFYDRDQRALDYSVASADPSVATVEVDRNGVLTIRGVSRGVTAITVTVADRRDERASDTFLVAVKGPALVALLPRASDPVREGFVRVINHDAEAGEVTIEAVDDTGVRRGPITLSVDAGATAHFNSGDLEDGNAAKGLPTGVGSGEGDWRLVLDSDLDFEALSYIRTADGFLTAMHDTVPVRDGAYEVAIFNPGSNENQVSRLRLVNLGAEDAQVTITGIDDAGVSPGSTVALTVPSGASRTIAAADLEAGAEGFNGSLGDGLGKWRLRVESDQPIVVMSLLSSPTGHLTNLSSAPDRGPY